MIHDKSLPPDPDAGALTFAQVADAWQRLTGESIHHAQAGWMWANGNGSGLASEYRRGRVLLAGDAAHSIPPLAAWGLSAGLQDAANLGWKLAATINGWAPDGLLDTYNAERQPIGRQLVRNAQAASMLYLGDTDVDPTRTVLSELMTDKHAAEHLIGIVSGLGIRYDVGPGEHPKLGKRMPPDREVTLADGSIAQIADLLNSARGVLLTNNGSTEFEQIAQGWADRVDLVSNTRPHRSALNAVLIRPDGYVAWTSPGSDFPLADALQRWFGAPRTAAAASRPVASSEAQA